MRKIIQIMVLLMLTGLICPLFASEIRLPLNTAVALAVQNSSELQTAALTLQKTKNSLNVNDLLPGFSLGATAGYQNVDLINNAAGLKNFQLALNAGVSFTLSSSKFANKSTKELELSSAELSYSSRVYSTAASATTGYWNLVSLENSIQQAKRSLETARTALERTVEMYENSRVSELSRLQAEIGVSDAELSLADAENRYSTALEDMCTTLGLVSGTTFVLDQLPDIGSLDFSKLGDIAEQYAEETTAVRSARTALQLQQLSNENAEKNAKSPSVSLNTSLNYRPSLTTGTSKPFSQSLNLTAQVALTVPLDAYIEGTQANANLKNNLLSEQAAELAVENAIKNIKTSADSIINSINQTVGSRDSLLLHSRLSETNLKLVTEAYNNAYASYTELQNAQTSYANAEASVLSNQITAVNQLCSFAALLEIDFGSLIEYLKQDSSEYETNGVQK